MAPREREMASLATLSNREPSMSGVSREVRGLAAAAGQAKAAEAKREAK